MAVFADILIAGAPLPVKVQGAEPLEPATLQVPSGFDISKAGTRQEYIRVRLVNNHGAQELKASFNNQGSSIMTSISWADGLAEIPIGKTVSKGQLLKYFPFRSIL